MTTTDYGFVEVLTDNPHLEVGKNASSSYLQKNILTGIVKWPPFSPPLYLKNGAEFSQHIICLLQISKIIPE